MATLLKLRLDERTHKRIALFARQNKTSSSEVVRRAVESWACLHLP
jgi:predicted HicB family RNase H-like nuclease